jgi:hypothetical protein
MFCSKDASTACWLAIILALVGCGGPDDAAGEQATAPWLEQAVTTTARVPWSTPRSRPTTW